MRRFIFIFFIFSFLACSSTPSTLTFDTTTVTLQTNINTLTITAEVADTQTKREQGLQNRTSLDGDVGMLFIFDEAGTHSFWMKDTPLSLDMIFFSSEKEIVFIEENTTPLSTALITPTSAALYVLEVNAGYVETNGIQVGDTANF